MRNYYFACLKQPETIPTELGCKDLRLSLHSTFKLPLALRRLTQRCQYRYTGYLQSAGIVRCIPIWI